MLRVIATLLISLLLVLTACGGGKEPADQGQAGKEQTTLRVGVLPIVSVAPLYLGMQKGFFKEEGLKIEPQQTQGGAAVIPSIISGDFQIGYSNIVSLMIAADRNLPLQVIAAGAHGGEDESTDYSAILVKKGSSIRDAADLQGKSIAVNTLKNVGELTIKAALEKEGADVSKIRFVEIPFPDMAAALEASRVDAVWVVEPFVTGAEAAGAMVLVRNYSATAPKLAVDAYFSSRQYIQENRDVVDGFIRAMRRSLEYASQNEQEARNAVLTFTKIPKDVVADIRLPNWQPNLNIPTVELQGKLAKKYGLVNEAPNISELVAPQAGAG